ncbi:cytochrome P450 [Exidia glandulosa HHB12029]|uniref:Cytochrome P450 n=1 Tax=Exidia glandulosa HHB12029 TaxID=1314781 RepID=A0A165HKS5_EXIGL|nr:cytochrome P450 [Exidia glandulosa HHB12029]
MAFYKIAGVLALLWIIRRVFKQKLPLLSPPNSSLLWGHEKQAFDEPAGSFYGRWFDVFGPAFKIDGALGYGEILVIADPGALAHMYIKKTYDYGHSPFFRPLIDRLLGKSLVWVDGAEDHGKMRRMLNPFFSAESIKHYSNDVVESAHRLQHKLSEHVQTHDRAVTINLLDWTWRVTLDIIGRVGFNHDFGCGESPEAKDIARSWKETISLGMDIAGLIAPAVLRAFPFITDLPVKSIQAQGEIKTIVRKLGTEMIAREGQHAQGKDLLSVLIRENAANGNHETSDQLLDHVVTFVMVGHETVAGALNYTLWELARNPDVQDKLRQEILAFPGEPTYEDLNGPALPYLDAVLKEALRVHPPSAHTEKAAEHDDIIPLKLPVRGADGTWIKEIPVKAGQIIYVPSIAVNRLHSVWGDGDKFRPDRWIEENGLPPASNLNLGWAHLFSFSQGPRNCIGFRLAIYEWKVIVMTLLRNFKFHDTGDMIQSKFSSTLQPRVIGREKEGCQLPVRVTLLHDDA